MKSLIALMITGLLASTGALAQESKSAAPAAPAASAPAAGAPAGEEPAKKSTTHHKKKHHKTTAKAETDSKKSGATSGDAGKSMAPAESSEMKK